MVFKIGAGLLIGIMSFIFNCALPAGNFACAEEGAKTGDGEAIILADFKRCTKLAVRQSPYLTESEIEIDIRRLMERESRGSFIPSINVRTIKYLEEDEDEPMLLTFSTGGYNPLAPFLSLKASKLITRIAILAHLQGISKGIHELARKFLLLNFLGGVKARQDKMVAFAQQKLAFCKKRHAEGFASLLEVQIAAQELDVTRAEREEIFASRALILENLHDFLGLKPGQKLHLNLREARCQVLSHFDPAIASLGQARAHSFELKIQELKKQAQKYRIYMAYSKFLPKVSFGVRDIDAFDARKIEKDEDYYINIGVELNLWNGFKEVNDVSRQKMVLRKYKNEMRLKEDKVDILWSKAQRGLKKAKVALKLAQSNVELTRLKKYQSEIRYKTNGESLPTLLNNRIAHLNFQKKALAMNRDHDLSVLTIRHLSGDLFNTFVDKASWKE